MHATGVAEFIVFGNVRKPSINVFLATRWGTDVGLKFQFMYEPLLLIHSWVRWAVLLGAVYFFCVSLRALRTKRAWSASDAHFIWAFNQAFLYQGLFGFTLWLAASPVVHAVFMDPTNVLSSPFFAYWSVFHPALMISAIGVFHFGKSRAKRQRESDRFRTYAIIFGSILVLMACAIPWPFLDYGRPLLRTP